MFLFIDMMQIVEVWWHQIYRCWVGTGASAVLCQLVAFVFRKETMKCIRQTLHFMQYIHKENFTIWTAPVTGKEISYANSMEPPVAVLRYLRPPASFSWPVRNQTDNRVTHIPTDQFAA
jgi:hypothetical protein